MNDFKDYTIRLANQQDWVVSKATVEISSNDYLTAKTQALAKSQHTMDASQAGLKRTPALKYQRQLMGSLAEIIAKKYLQTIICEQEQEKNWQVIRYDDVRTDCFKNPANEYDIRLVQSSTQKIYTVECRSSIARDRSLTKAIETFDIIGPYISATKKAEMYNDIYLRPLYTFKENHLKNYDESLFENYLCNGMIHLYIVAGCTKEEMKKVGYEKNMKQQGTTYRVAKITDCADANKFQKKIATLL